MALSDALARDILEVGRRARTEEDVRVGVSQLLTPILQSLHLLAPCAPIETISRPQNERQVPS